METKELKILIKDSIREVLQEEKILLNSTFISPESHKENQEWN